MAEGIRTLYTLRYRQGSIGVQTGYVVASSLAKAEQVGQAWCNQEAFRKYIGVIPAILADESILEPEEVPAAPAPPAPEKRKAS